MEKLIKSINFKLLRAQKTVLNKMLSKRSVSYTEKKAIEGLLNLIDHIQDTAVDTYGVNGEDVYNHTDINGNLKVPLKQCRQIVEAD